MTELKQRLKELENQISEMVFDFHKSTGKEPMIYKIEPVFIDNKRANGERRFFIKHEITSSYPKEKIADNEYVEVVLKRMNHCVMHKDEKIKLNETILNMVSSFCEQNNISYLNGDIGFGATKENKLLFVNCDILLKP